MGVFEGRSARNSGIALNLVHERFVETSEKGADARSVTRVVLELVHQLLLERICVFDEIFGSGEGLRGVCFVDRLVDDARY